MNIISALIGAIGEIIAAIITRLVPEKKESLTNGKKWMFLVCLLIVSVIIIFAYIFLHGQFSTDMREETLATDTREETIATDTQEETIATEFSNSSDSKTHEPSESIFADSKPGEIIEFGKYRAEKDTDGEYASIKWLVLDRQDDKILVISKYGLDTRPFHNKSEQITWKDSSVHGWLNSIFIDSAFLEDEQQQILEVSIEPDKGTPGYSSVDKIFF